MFNRGYINTHLGEKLLHFEKVVRKIGSVGMRRNRFVLAPPLTSQGRFLAVVRNFPS